MNNQTYDVAVRISSSIKDFNNARSLFREYADEINYKEGFRDFETELAILDTKYAAPEGSLMLAHHMDQAVGCVALLQLAPGIVELKRFYVQPEFRNLKLGAKLLDKAIAVASQLGYKYLRLEVIPSLVKARKLYREFGFYPIQPFKEVVIPDTAFMEMKLSAD